MNSAAPHVADPPAQPAPRSWSGRWTVGLFALAVILIWGGLDQAFRSWQRGYRVRAEFGARVVAPTVDPLAALVPPEVPPATWRSAVADTHAILLALTASGLLDQAALATLHQRLRDQVAGATARPATARAVLIRIWDDLARDAGPAITPDDPTRPPPPPGSRLAARRPRPPRPAVLGPAPSP